MGQAAVVVKWKTGRKKRQFQANITLQDTALRQSLKAPMVIINWLRMFTTQESDFLKNFGRIPMPPVSLLCDAAPAAASELALSAF